MEVRNNDGELPLCVAASECHISIVNFLLERYRDMGPANLQEALERPCGKGGLLSQPLLAHVPRLFSLRDKAGAPSTEAQVSMLRHLVHKWKANIWQPISSGMDIWQS